MVDGGLCDRVGCGELAACALLMAPQDTEVWLVDVNHDAALDGIGLCGIHADRITVPFGWSFTDDRSPSKAKRKRRATKTVAAKPADSPGPDVPTESALSAKQKAPTPKPKAKSAKKKRPKPAKSAAATAQTSESDVGPDPLQSDETAMPPAGDVDHPSSPPEVPVGADASRLSVVPTKSGSDSDLFDFEDDGQGALWAGEAELDETTPLLKRAFRVVRDD